ncbi:hypothetical protein EVJ58_g10541 [Rhodofomes roseus]|uniref:Yippee domain-containing protein n=1 Tax=Rhodofomes roseus TaxID=34475 RepID=A0A4Y9XQL6_9APHY|nr:hypothetical protein EVJ58_g10541 [Rhodofomes roseus]
MQGPHRGGRVDHRSAQTGFRGYKGKAVLYASTLNTVLAAPSILLMDTGAHTIQEAACAPCGTYLGWKIVRAHEASEKWKEGRFLPDRSRAVYRIFRTTPGDDCSVRT